MEAQGYSPTGQCRTRTKQLLYMFFVDILLAVCLMPCAGVIPSVIFSFTVVPSACAISLTTFFVPSAGVFSVTFSFIVMPSACIILLKTFFMPSAGTFSVVVSLTVVPSACDILLTTFFMPSAGTFSVVFSFAVVLSAGTILLAVSRMLVARLAPLGRPPTPPTTVSATLPTRSTAVLRMPSRALRSDLASLAHVGTRLMMPLARLSTATPRMCRMAERRVGKGVLDRTVCLPMRVLRRSWWTVENYFLSGCYP